MIYRGLNANVRSVNFLFNTSSLELCPSAHAVAVGIIVIIISPSVLKTIVRVVTVS